MNTRAISLWQQVTMMDGGIDVLLVRVDGRVRECVFRGVECEALRMLTHAQ
jgi:hypothetical protein